MTRDGDLARFRRVQELFTGAMELPPARRPSFLRDRTRDDATVSDEVLDLLQEAARSESTFAARARDAALDAVAADPAPAPAARVGAYRLVERPGEGGMGTVYRAEQETPIRRNVALKILQAGPDDDDLIARFLQEQQVLARMDDDAIARIYDAGSTAEGSPFFAMELVPGRSCTKFCDDHRLPLNVRLRIVVRTCLAVQHAHERGVVHRDLSPANVMVRFVAGEPTPKIIDFGLALLRESGADRRLTSVGQVLGTPGYMAPEQARGAIDAIDERSDVHALGALLCELLTSMPPCPDRGRSGRTPSLLLATLADGGAAAAAARQTTPARLRAALRDGLDRIVLRAIAEAKVDRYPTAEALADDLRRVLDGRAVEARPGGSPRRTRRMRHRWIVLNAAALIALGVEGYAHGRGPRAVGRPSGSSLAAIHGGVWRLDGADLVQSSLVSTSRRAVRQETTGASMEPGNTFLFGDPDWTDYDLTVAVRAEAGEHGFKVCFHAADSTTYCTFAVGSYYNKATDLSCFRAGLWHRDPKHLVDSGIDLSVWHEVRLEVRGARVRCCLDGEQVFTAATPGFTRGAVGFETWRSAARFRALCIRTPTGEILMRGFPRIE
jgi:serine/threonine protein kinase